MCVGSNAGVQSSEDNVAMCMQSENREVTLQLLALGGCGARDDGMVSE